MDQIVEPSDRKSNDVRSRMRMLSLVWSHFPRRTAAHFAGKCFKSENARAILLAVGIAALFALASYYGEHRGEHQTSVPGCDGDLCGNAVANATPATGNPEEAPTGGRVQNDDQYRQPGADTHRLAARNTKGNLPGIVTSRKTGARARVGIAHAARFQAYIDDLETNHGARILFMGGIRPGHCSSSGMHPCGKALDVCQLSRGVVDPRCRLPPRRTLAQIASSHGLFEGGRWCNSDYGHVQLGVTAGDCGDQRTRIVRRQTAPETRREAAVASFE